MPRDPFSMADVSLVGILSRSGDEVWDLEDSTPDDRLWTSPLGRFVAGIRDTSQGQRAMQLLALFVARRAVACWQLYCDGNEPLDGIRTAERVLEGQAPSLALRAFVEPAVPSYRGTPIVDCRECDTSCAATAVAHLARLIADGDARDLAICLSAADMAFDQSPLARRDQFRRWLTEVAAPAALDERPLSDEEASRFRDYSAADLISAREAEHAADLEAVVEPQRRWYRFW